MAETEDLAEVIGGELEVVEPESTSLALPNGVLIDLENISEVVQGLKDLDLLVAQVKSAKKILLRVVMEEAAREGVTGKMRVGSLTVTIAKAKEIEWDMDELEKLRDAGLPAARWDELVTETVTTKVNATVATQIGKANAEYQKIIDRARTDHDKNPSVSVT